MRADRLLMIMSLLQTHGQLSSRELAVQLEVSERTIHRDMEALSVAGIPVYAERGPKGGWALSEGYRNQMTGMTTDEIRSLLLLHSSSVVRDLGLQDQVQTAFRKLFSALPLTVQRETETVRELIHVDGAGWHSSIHSEMPCLPIVQEAIWAQRKLKIVYRSWDSVSETERFVCPLGLVAKQSIWYLIAQTEEEIRTYRISRLKNASMLEETFSRPGGFDLAAYWEQSTKNFKSNLPRFPASVKVASARWSRFSQERYVTVLTSEKVDDEGWVKADVEFNTLESACEIILGYGRHVQALSPALLCHSVYEESKAVVSLYGSESE
ncbi:helix-turn-helix transcriptional regulator [Cohnella silvisoli]|uniref:WYL domain-containing protein n=1 Tax=Cohnella silvisoli TaxID=2873699 RepID=A0ABV1KPW9_9BACL|nr:WYL domain-containing protein [Cohnella silvisoli]MCD9022191.1 WYL domain-containing protein [Cohnella silvisoli]